MQAASGDMHNRHLAPTGTHRPVELTHANSVPAIIAQLVAQIYA